MQNHFYISCNKNRQIATYNRKDTKEKAIVKALKRKQSVCAYNEYCSNSIVFTI